MPWARAVAASRAPPTSSAPEKVLNLGISPPHLFQQADSVYPGPLGRSLPRRSRGRPCRCLQRPRKRETEPGSGTSRIVPSAMLTKISREMAMFQTVLEVLDEVDGSAAA